jgi:hypothetical protein
MRTSSVLPVVALIGSCSSSSAPAPADTADASGSDGGTGDDAAAPAVTEHGSIIDYGTLLSSGSTVPVAGLTVTDGAQSTTTDAKGNWSLMVPAGASLSPSISGTTKGDPYSTLFLPTATSAGGDVDRGTIVVADQSTFQLERLILSADSTKAIVHVAATATGSCASVAGGTISVTAPAGASVVYFNAKGLPSSTATSFPQLPFPGPVAVIYDVDPGADVTFQVSHPTCTPSPAPVTNGGASFTGQVVTKAAEPGDFCSVVLTMLQ